MLSGDVLRGFGYAEYQGAAPLDSAISLGNGKVESDSI